MELLKKLYSIHSMSGQEKKMKKFIKSYIRENIPDAEVTNDNSGNLYIIKGKSDTYPCVVAHLDQVQDRHSKDFEVVEMNGQFFGFSRTNLVMEGLGADDKNGIWIALKCLEKFDALKVAFFVQEECGCVGSSRAKLSFFDDCRFIIEPDRKGNSDLITNMGGTIHCSEEFKTDIHPEKFGYKETTGLLTDILTLVEDGVELSCINVSCGYYRPHTDTEYVVIDDLLNCLHFVYSIIENCTKVYPFKCVSSFDSYSSHKWSGSYLGGTSSAYNSARPDIELVDIKDYDNVYNAIETYIYYNVEDYSAAELWEWMSEDCINYGFTEDQFYEVYDSVVDWIDYNESYHQSVNEDNELSLAY